MKYVVIGGAGFIGSHLVEKLQEQGDEVIVVDSFAAGTKENVKEGHRVVQADLQNDTIKKLLIEEQPDVVYHLAGAIQLKRPITDERFSSSTHVFAGTKNLLDAIVEAKIKKLVLTSSAGAIYEGAQEFPTPETYQAHPTGMYGLMSLLIERLAQQYAKEYDLHIITLRPSNVYGPRQWQDGIIPSFIKAIKEGNPPVIHGDGSETRDFLYVTDVVDAFLKAATTEKTGIYNVGSEVETSFKEVFEEIASALSWEKAPQYDESKKGSQMRSAVSISKIKQDLGWSPSVSFHDGIIKTVKAHQ